MRNRQASQDLDYFLDDRALGSALETVRTELRRLISAVGDELHYDANWANDEVRMFLTLLKEPNELFRRSKQQGVKLYQDSNIIIYAALWEWVLVRKLKRLQMEGQVQRREDWNDCVAITKLLYDKSGQRLSLDMLKQFDHTEREPPVLAKTITDLRRVMVQLQKVDPFPTISETRAAPTAGPSSAQAHNRQSLWVFSTRDCTLQYRSRDGNVLPQAQWPAQRGRVQVYVIEDKAWKLYDFDKRIWVNM